MLATYLRADRNRLPILRNIMDRLDNDGAVGDRARYYIVFSSFLRAVLRATLVALCFKLPSWSMETPAAAKANRQFVAGYQDRRKRG